MPLANYITGLYVQNQLAEVAALMDIHAALILVRFQLPDLQQHAERQIFTVARRVRAVVCPENRRSAVNLKVTRELLTTA